ncbi:uncharacterized protein BO97DRAFT_423796 [Aspergillus homomorphus CBS 101889]|uniref:Uncharacterized protein n=1 Tax=Aspergillus homomorphus (strain CBS 101889) TaxID=1450537 RepID=A0A395HYS5_ASPHC|nr:hypothetical protein BO97DRAFT_423796 [Aspergillus homomorphus CBS 101889]RAL13092.1 hypothetical protein BO97DRAFT_423796 [Aspergillus homomorphus CBS 101889]
MATKRRRSLGEAPESHPEVEAIAGLVLCPPCEFNILHAAFQAGFGQASFIALTDGVLWAKHGKYIRAIIEVKKNRRDKDLDNIRLQESAEVVSWVRNEYEGCFYGQAMISEDGDQAWFIFDQPTETYKSYLAEGIVDANAFVDLSTYGPLSYLTKSILESYVSLLQQ